MENIHYLFVSHVISSSAVWSMNLDIAGYLGRHFVYLALYSWDASNEISRGYK